ncbi:MAG: peptidylprolyl isomerase [Pseudomonadota bacterium]
MRFLISFCVLVSSFFSPFVFFPVTTASAEIIDRIVAVVNDDVITLADLESEQQLFLEYMRAENPDSLAEKGNDSLRMDMLNKLIDRKLTEQEAQRIGLSVSETEIDAAVERILQNSRINKDQLAARLKQEGVPMERYRQNLKEQIQRGKLVSQEVRSKVVITDDKVKEYYQNNRNTFNKRMKYRLRHIVFKMPAGGNKETIRKKADDVKKQLQEGADFEELARIFSEFPTASEGGDLGYVEKDELAPYIIQAVTGLGVNDVSPVVETPVGYQIFKVVDSVEPKEKAFEEVKEEIYLMLTEQYTNNRFAAWIKDLRAKSYIEVLL